MSPSRISGFSPATAERRVITSTKSDHGSATPAMTAVSSPWYGKPRIASAATAAMASAALIAANPTIGSRDSSGVRVGGTGSLIARAFAPRRTLPRCRRVDHHVHGVPCRPSMNVWWISSVTA